MPMTHKTIWISLFLIVLAGGAFFRLWRLDDRPMHTDEAVHAEKFGNLLEKRIYTYNPDEFHGPTLNYFTLFSAVLRGETSSDQITEATLRLTPAVFGILLILTPLLFIRMLGVRAVIFCSVLIAFSPGFIYYSRYYIQETPLLFFTACFLGCFCNYLSRPRLYWLVLSGVAVGLMHATKETFIFSIAAAVIALGMGILSRDSRPKAKLLHVICGVAAAVLVSIIFYSSFGGNADGILDSAKTYFTWAGRATGNSVHNHPWYFYLDLLTWLEFIEPVVWNEDGIVALAVIGWVIVFLRQGGRRYRCGRFLVIYTLVLTVIYSIIPYKTPWSMMSFVYGMALVAGFAADQLLRSVQGTMTRTVFWILILIYGLAAPIAQSSFLNFRYAADPTNPYVYAHTGTDVFKMVDAVQEAVNASKDGEQTWIHIIANKDDYWPLPWYLRGLSQVGYWGHVDKSACQSPIILANADHQQELLQVLYTVPEPGQRHLYVPLFDEALYLRPGVEWQGYIQKDVWDQMQRDSDPVVQTMKAKNKALESIPDRKMIENLVKSSHRAMNANFEIFIQHEDGTYAGRAARAAFNEVDRLETLLSRYIENSDVSRINELRVGEEAIVDKDTIKCLQIAQRAYQLTDGAFNSAIGDLIAARKQGNSERLQSLLSEMPTPEMLELNAEDYTVKVLREGVSIDLGGIGKGYAIDAITEILTEWGIKKAMIHGGASSVCALEPPTEKAGWPVVIRNPIDESVIAHLELANEVLSCSGLQRGDHIINPFTGEPVTDRRACWIRTQKSAALADALTTAGMIMPIGNVMALHEKLPETSVMLLMSETDQSGGLIQQGHWPN
jgi:uncharacterized protein (TIGR03663 family)